jgi:hypothetical protein
MVARKRIYIDTQAFLLLLQLVPFGPTDLLSNIGMPLPAPQIKTLRERGGRNILLSLRWLTAAGGGEGGWSRF